MDDPFKFLNQHGFLPRIDRPCCYCARQITQGQAYRVLNKSPEVCVHTDCIKKYEASIESRKETGK